MDRTTLTKRTKPVGKPAGLAAVLILLIAMIVGCDQIDASQILSKAGVGETSDDTTSAELAIIDPSMESVGPEGATRIYYQFVDSSGRVQFVERITDVPVAWRAQVGFVEMNQPPPLTPLAARRSWQVSSTRTAQILAGNVRAMANADPTQRRTQREDVILYFADWCGYCKQAQAHLDREDIDYELRNVDNDAIKNELREKTGRTGIPVLDFSGEVLRGYSAVSYNQAIRRIRS
jgi:glutaredoxin